jgi:succinate dehydrogenase/fumarate reductase flavoprotein subunit
MAVNKLKTEQVETDMLCIGGGPAGLSAAIEACELGARVLVADKADTLRSGDAGMGNDHFRCYIPEVHGDDIEATIRDLAFTQAGGGRPHRFIKAFMERSFETVKRWEEWGIPMKYEGRYEFAGHAYPGRPRYMLHYSGMNTKPQLTKEARRVGAQIMNRVMVFDLLKAGGNICGAIGVDTREPRLIVFRAKSILLGTGKAMRLFPGPTPAWLFNTSTSPANTGDGRAMAYRAGCELANLELSTRWAGPKYFARNGKGSWMGVLRDPQGKPIGPFVTKPDRESGDMTLDMYKGVYEDYAKSGRGPVYMDLGGMSDEDYQYMKYWLIHEANGAIIDHLEGEGADPRDHPIEFMTYGLITPGGVCYDENGATPVPGLYAAGDEYEGLFMAGAAVFGRIAGQNAGRYARAVQAPEIDGAQSEIDRGKSLLEEVLGREGGIGWQEANIALQQVMLDYCGLVRSDSILQAGLDHLHRLKKKVREGIMAGNQHELMRALEVLNLYDLGELVMTAARERKETRGGHRRADYPYTNPMLNDQLLLVQKKNGGPGVAWKKK